MGQNLKKSITSARVVESEFMLYTLEELPIGTKVFIDRKMGRWRNLKRHQLPPNLELVIAKGLNGSNVSGYLWCEDQEGGEWYIDEDWPIKVEYQCFDCRTNFTGDLHYLCPRCRERVINDR